MSDQKRHAPATLRNRDAILNVLQRVLPLDGVLLEIASGTGEHAAYMAPLLPGSLRWQPSDSDAAALASIDAHAAGQPSILKAIQLDVRAARWPIGRADAVFCANMIHIAPSAAAEGLFAGIDRILSEPGVLVLYGPFKRHGEHTALSNAEFDASLKARDPRWGVRCLDNEVAPLAGKHGLMIDEIVPMPANNLSVVFRRN